MIRRLQSSLRLRGVRGTIGAFASLLWFRLLRAAARLEDAAYRASGLQKGRLRSAIASGRFSGGTVLTAKFDAFGGRLGDIINGMRVAEALGARFRFYWPDRELPGIRPAAEVFDEEFLEKHHLDDPRLRDHTVVGCWRLRDLAALRRGRTVWYQSKADCGEGKFNPSARGFVLPELASFAEVFDRLPLQKRLAEVRDWARSLPTFDAAVHVRRGDIFSGDFRFGSGFSDKMIPLPVLEHILGIIATAESEILLVGNALESVRQRLGMTARLSVPEEFVYPGASAPDLDDLRDFCLLSRAQRVIAGHSVFALIPALIGEAQLQDPIDLVTEDEMAALILGFVRENRGTPDLEVALGCEYFRKRFPARMSMELETELVEIALVADPDNPVYRLRVAAEAAREGDTAQVRSLFEAMGRTSIPETIVRMTRCDLDLDRGVGLSNIWSGYLRAGDRETIFGAIDMSPWAAFIAAAELSASGDFKAAGRAMKLAAPIAHEAAVAAVAAIVADPPAGLPATRGGLLIRPTAEDLGQAPMSRSLFGTRTS